MNINSSLSRFNEVTQYLSPRLSRSLGFIKDTNKCRIEEIRLRVNKGVSVTLPFGSRFVSQNGELLESCENAVKAAQEDINNSLGYLCNMSLYSHQNQIKNGFITVRGGHRVGLCGTAVVEGISIENIRDISSLNLRIAREIKGCADEIYNELFKNSLDGCLIVSPPCGGKTTILRDLSRLLSNSGKKVAVIDERGEIAATFEGIAQNDLGELTDVLDGYPKHLGIIQAIRTLSPQIVICDEVGDEEDVYAVSEGMKTGVPIVMSCHSKSMEELKRRTSIMKLIEIGAVQSIVLLHGYEEPCKIKRIFKAEELR